MYTKDNPDPAWLAEDAAATRDAEELYNRWYSAMEDRAAEETAMPTIEQIVQAELEASRAYEQTTFHQGFTVAALRDCFNRITDGMPNWKDPLAVWVPGELVLITVAAIDFFTATHATVSLDQRTMRYLVESIGYQAGPAGDH